MPVAGLQPCDRSKITLISTTEPQEGGFGKSRHLEFNDSLAACRDCNAASRRSLFDCATLPQHRHTTLIQTITLA